MKYKGVEILKSQVVIFPLGKNNYYTAEVRGKELGSFSQKGIKEKITKVLEGEL